MMKLIYISLIALLTIACNSKSDQAVAVSDEQIENNASTSEPRSKAEKAKRVERNEAILDSLMGEEPFMKRREERKRRKELRKQGYTEAEIDDKLNTTSGKTAPIVKKSAGTLKSATQKIAMAGELNLPVVSELLTPSFIAGLVDLPVERVELESDQHQPEGRMSRATWSWNDATTTFQRLTVNLNSNPLPEELLNWDEQSMDNFLEKGLQFADGRTISFEEINKDGIRYAWSDKEHILKWFYNSDYTFNIAGIGAGYGDKETFLNIAERLNRNIGRSLKSN